VDEAEFLEEKLCPVSEIDSELLAAKRAKSWMSSMLSKSVRRGVPGPEEDTS